MEDQRASHADFFKAQFDKLLLLTIIVYFSIAAFHAYHTGAKEMAAFAVDNAKLFSGALLTLITGKFMMREKPNGNGNGGNGTLTGKPIETPPTT